MTTVWDFTLNPEIELPCGKSFKFSPENKRNQTIFRLHKKKCARCADIKFEKIADGIDEMKLAEKQRFSKIKTGGTNCDTHLSSVDADSGEVKQLQ
jgi:hypothetical protein